MQALPTQMAAALRGAARTLKEKALSTAEAIEAAGGRALPIVGDVRNDDDVTAAVLKTQGEFGGIDVVEANAETALRGRDRQVEALKAFVDAALDAFDGVIDDTGHVTDAVKKAIFFFFTKNFRFHELRFKVLVRDETAAYFRVNLNPGELLIGQRFQEKSETTLGVAFAIMGSSVETTNAGIISRLISRTYKLETELKLKLLE